MLLRHTLSGLFSLFVTLIVAVVVGTSTPVLIRGNPDAKPENRLYTLEELDRYARESREFRATYKPPPFNALNEIARGINRIWWLPLPVFFLLSLFRRRKKLVDEILVALPLLFFFAVPALSLTTQLMSIGSGIAGLFLAYMVFTFLNRNRSG